jgi:threonine/homoserine/homoserine lactone efflux protein
VAIIGRVVVGLVGALFLILGLSAAMNHDGVTAGVALIVGAASLAYAATRRSSRRPPPD